VAITKNLRPFHRDEAASHHLLQFREESLDFLGFVHDLHDNRQIQGKSQDTCIVKVSRAAETHRAAQDRSTREMQFPSSQHNCPVEWVIHIFIGFPQENTQKRALLRQIPRLWGWRRFCGGEIWDWLGHCDVESRKHYHHFINEKLIATLGNYAVKKEAPIFASVIWKK
jgi:hypothetical protein